MSRKPVDIFAVVAITLVAVGVALLVPPHITPIRILTLPLMLVLPGYALTPLLWPEHTLRFPERLVFSVGVSMAVVILGALLLNWTPWGLRTSSWTALLGATTLGACAVVLRRHGEGASLPRRSWIGSVGLTLRQALLLGLAGGIVCGAMAVAVIGAERQSYAGFTQLWMLRAGRAGANHRVRMGISNGESTAMVYRLAVDLNGKLVHVWPSIHLKSNGKWERMVVLPPTSSTSVARVGANLYRASSPQRLYRHVVLWLGRQSAISGSGRRHTPRPRKRS